MRKNLLFFLMAMLMPCLAWADNMAIERTKPDSYASGWGTKRDNRLGVPCEAAGFSSPMSGTENYTISAWINPTGVNNGGVILALSPQVHFNNNGNWVLMSSPSGELSLGGHGGDNDHGAGAAGLVGDTNAKITIAEWNYVTVVVDNANLKFNIYVNGELGDSKTMNEALYFPANLQNGGDGPAWFHVAAYGVTALIDEVHAFNTALSAAEVAQAYKNPLSVASLTGYFTFDEESDTVGYFDNLAENAPENSSAVYWAWSTNYTDWISGTNKAASPTLVPGREIAPAEVKYTFAVPTAEQLGLSEIMFLTEDDEMLSGGQSYELVEGTEISFMATSSAAYIIAGVTVNGVAAEIQEQGDGSMVYGRFVINSNIDSDAIVFDLQKKAEEGGSIELNGVDQYMRIPHSADFEIPKGGKMTISAKVNLESGNNAGIFSNRYRTTTSPDDCAGVDLYFVGAANVFGWNVNVNASSWQNICTGVSRTLKLNEWQTVTWVFDGFEGECNVYLDGVLVGETASNKLYPAQDYPIDSKGDILFGARYNTDAEPNEVNMSQLAKGKFSDIRIYSDALSATEVVADMEGAVEGKNLIAAYNFAEINGNKVTDITGNGHTAELVGFAAANTATLTIEQPENGTLTVKNGEETLATGAEVEIGTELTVAAEPAEGYQLVAVKVNGTAIEGNTFSMTEEGATVSAEFEAAAPAITYRSLSTDGSVRYFSELAYTVGEETKVIYHTDDATQEDYYVAPTNGKWSEEGVYIDFTDKVLEVPANAGDFTMIIKSTISGQWTKWNQTAVFVDWNNNGQFNDAGETNGVLDLSAKPNNKITTAEGQSDVIALPEGIQPGTYTILIITNEPKGYDCTGDMWEKNWEWTEGIFNDGVCSVANGHAYALTLKVTEAAAAPTYALTIQQPENAVITVKNGEEAAENGAKFEAGTQLTLEAACEAGYNLVNFTLDGQPVEGNTVTVPEADFTVSATVAAIDYCESTETTSRSGRGITSIDVNGVTINGNGSSGTRSVFVDRTETVVTARAGETLSFASEGTGSWMHTFIYIDYNQNGWDFEPESTSLHGDLVWFQQLCPESLLKSHTTPSSQNKETFYDMEGNNVGEAEYPYGGVNATVTIPADLAPGDYRVRYKLDWASANPCGNPTQLMGTNGSNDNGGTMIDFTLRVEAAAQGSTVSVAVAEGQGTMGTVSIDGVAGSSVVTNDEVTVVAEANTTLGAKFLNWTKDGEVVSTDARYTFTPDADAALVANFGWVVNFNAVQTDGFMSVKKGEQAITSGSAFAPGTELTVIVVANDGKKVESVTASGTEIELTEGQGTFTVNGYTQLIANFVDMPTYSFTATVTGNGRVEIWNDRDESTDEPKGNRTLSGGKLIEGEEANIYFFPGVVSGDKYETVVAFDLTDTGESYTLEDLDYYKVICHYNNNYTMYPFLVSGDIDIKVTFSNELAGIADILFDGIEGETEYYDLNGVRVDAENIQNGVYILRRGNVTKKVYIRK